jgi:hypothetical protein
MATSVISNRSSPASGKSDTAVACGRCPAASPSGELKAADAMVDAGTGDPDDDVDDTATGPAAASAAATSGIAPEARSAAGGAVAAAARAVLLGCD